MARGMAGDAGARTLLIGVVLACVMAACGGEPQPEVQSATPLTAQTVQARQTGNAAAQLITQSITFQLDDSGSLVIHADVMSQAAAAETITARASLYDAGGSIIGDATGGEVAVPPGGTASLQLNGPGPHGTIASAVFELSDVAAPTPVVTTPVPAGTQ